MLKVYPAIFQQEGDSYWVEFPDLPGCHTCGDSLEKTMELAQEALGLYLVSVLEDGEALPQHSNLTDLTAPANGILSYVSTDLTKYRRNTRAVKKTVSIPAWMAEEAEKTNISLSKVLQEGLREKLGG